MYTQNSHAINNMILHWLHSYLKKYGIKPAITDVSES